MLPSPTHEDAHLPCLSSPTPLKPTARAADPDLVVTPAGVTAAAPAGQEAQRVLEQLQALVDGLAIEPLDRSSQHEAITRLDPSDATVIPALAALVRRAESSVDAIVCSHPQNAEAGLRTLLTQAPDVAQVRLLCAPATTEQAVVAGSRVRPGRSTTRVCAVPLPELVVVDSRTALVRCTQAGAQCASMVRSAPVVRALHSLFAVMWRGATPAADHREIAQWLAASDMARQVLAQMGRGTTDEAAARELAMSVRTYRRYVAELMRVLGAGSRFQAGARAAHLGLLSSRG